MDMEITPSVAAEAIAVLENTEISLLAKVPLKLIQFLQEKADETTEKFELDIDKSYEEQTISEEARAIITLIHKDYWCTPEERLALEEKFEAEQERIDKELAEKYSPDKIFEKQETIQSSNENIESIAEEKSIIEAPKLSWYAKIINKIKSFFK